MRRKYFWSVSEFARDRHYSERHVRRLIHDGKIKAQKVGRNWQIFTDQSQDPKVDARYTSDGYKIQIPPRASKGLIWNMEKKRFVPIEKYAKENGFRTVNIKGKRLIDMLSNPEFKAEIEKSIKELANRGQWATLDSGERIFIMNQVSEARKDQS